MKRVALISSFVLFLILCGTTSFWVLQFMKPAPRKIVAPPMTKPVADVESVATLFGGAMAINTNYQLKGIVLANPQKQSEAIIVVDGQAAHAFTVGTEISTGVKLAEVHSGFVLISDNGVSKRIDLPDDFKSGGQSTSPSPITVPSERPRVVPPPSSAPGTNMPPVGDNSIVNHRRGMRPSFQPADQSPPNGTHPGAANPDAPALRPVQ